MSSDCTCLAHVRMAEMSDRRETLTCAILCLAVLVFLFKRVNRFIIVVLGSFGHVPRQPPLLG